MNGRFRFIPTDLMRLEPKTTFVNYHRKARKHGKSGYSFKDRSQVFLTALLDTSYKWIQLFTLTGLGLAFAGMLLMCSLIYGYFSNAVPFQGFTLITCLILLSAGLQIVILSLIGEYVWRTYDIARNKPLFVTRSVTKSNSIKTNWIKLQMCMLYRWKDVLTLTAMLLPANWKFFSPGIFWKLCTHYSVIYR